MTDFRKNFVVSMLAYAMQKDILPDALCRQAGIDFGDLQGGGKLEIGSDQLDLLWQNAVQRSGDSLFGLHFGEAMQLSALGIIGSIIRNSPTVGHALQQCAAFTPVLTDLFSMTVHRQGKRFGIRLIPFREKTRLYPAMQKQTLDLSLAFILHELDGLLLVKMKPELVILPFAPEQAAEYGRVLRCDHLHAGRKYYMEFDGGLWDSPIALANYELQGVLLAYAEQNKYVLDSGTSVRARITQLLNRNSYLGMPGLAEVAANLHLSVRSLQRRLREEGVSFQEIAESVRKTLALHYLEGRGHPLKEIAILLGYADIGAFTRAFKRWTGMTPTEYKRDQG